MKHQNRSDRSGSPILRRSDLSMWGQAYIDSSHRVNVRNSVCNNRKPDVVADDFAWKTVSAGAGGYYAATLAAATGPC